MDKEKLQELRNYYDNTSLTEEIKAAELNTEVIESPMIGITVRLPAEVLHQVRSAAAHDGLKTTALIRKWIEEAVQARSESQLIVSNVDDSRAAASPRIASSRDLALTA